LYDVDIDAARENDVGGILNATFPGNGKYS
jgi:hypothetical protein